MQMCEVGIERERNRLLHSKSLRMRCFGKFTIYIMSIMKHIFVCRCLYLFFSLFFLCELVKNSLVTLLFHFFWKHYKRNYRINVKFCNTFLGLAFRHKRVFECVLVIFSFYFSKQNNKKLFGQPYVDISRNF